MERLKIDLSIGNSDNDLSKMKDELYKKHYDIIALLKSFNVSDEIIDKYLVKIYDHALNQSYCASCPGQKNCKKDNPLLTSEIYFDGKAIEQRMSPCKEVLKDMNTANNFIINDMNEFNVNAKVSLLDKNKKEAAYKINNFFKNKESNWIYLTGNLRTGRSYLASAFANKCASKGVGTICYIDVPFRFKELYDKSFKDLDAYSKMLETIKTCDVLVLDDFGNEIKNDYIRDGILSLILSARVNKKLLTIITSDYTIEEIETLYSTTKAGAIRAKQIKNLLKTNCEVLDLGSISIY